MRNPILIILLNISLVSLGQMQDKVDFIHANVSIVIDPYSKILNGEVVYTFTILNKTDSIFLDAKNLKFKSVKLNNKKVSFTNNEKSISIKKVFKKGKSYKLHLLYHTIPKQTVYFVGWDKKRPSNRNQIWTQGQGKYTSHWLPSFDDMNEKVEFDLNITFNKNYDVISNGKLKEIQETDSLNTWYYDMKQPMSSYLLTFAIGEYHKKTTSSARGVPLEMLYYPRDSLKVEPTYRHTNKIFDFLEKEIGIPYPWQNYKQIPVKDFLYAGMENTGTTVFSDSYVIDSVSFIDKNFVNVNAHEMAHQWFGNMVTEVNGNHHWLHEGFATYYSLLAEKEIFGESYFYWKLYESAKMLDKLSRDGRGEALTNPKASSLTFYEKGAWALYILRSQVGDSIFNQGIQNYLIKFKFKNVTIADFLNEIEQVGRTDLSGFEELWLNGINFPMALAKESLKASSTEMADFFELQSKLTTSLEDKETIIRRYWDRTSSNELKKHMLSRYYKSFSDDFLRTAFETEEVKIRQVMALEEKPIPVGLKEEFESLLNDKSYRTIENMLYRLWVYFPEDRAKYLEITRNIDGFPNKNVRLLWLTLAIFTKDFDNSKKSDYVEELSDYTNHRFHFEVRQNAFQYLDGYFRFTDQNLKDLINASVHPAWQFKKFARNLLNKLLEDEEYKNRLTLMSKQLNGEELRYINNKLNTE